MGEVISWHLNWNPFKPKRDLLGDTVYVGWWAVVEFYDERLGRRRRMDMDAMQVQVKTEMGLIS